MHRLLIIILPLLLFACATDASKEPIKLSVPVEEMTKAIQDFRNTNGDLLYLLTIDSDGKVIKSDFIEGKVKYLDKQRLKTIGFHIRQQVTYPPAAVGGPEYRQTFFVTKYSSKVESN